MKTAKTVLAILLCLCMLPFSAFAYTVTPGGTHEAVAYTPAESGLYAVTVQKDGKAVSPLPAKEGAVYDPVMAVSVKTGDAEAQAVDYNVFYLVKGTAYSVQLQNISDGAYDDAGDWDVSVAKVDVKPLALNADALVEGEWFSFTPAEDGDYTLTAAPAPVFVEVLTEGAVAGDWQGYALDKETCRVGMELDYLRSLKAAIALRAEEIDLAERTYAKALDKLENYNKMIDLADKTGIGSEGTNLFNKKQAVYDALKEALLRGDETFQFDIPIIGNILPKLNLPTIDPEVVEGLPANVTDLPDYLTEKLQSSEGAVGDAKDKVDTLRTEQAADQAAYDAGLAANPQLEALLKDTSSETASLRTKVQDDADAILAATAGDAGMKLVAAKWQNGEEGMSVTLTKDTRYIIHVLSNLTTSAAVTDGTYTPTDPDDPDDPDPVTVDKSKLDKAIQDAKKVDTDLYTEASVAAMNEALTAAQTVQADENAAQAEVDAAAKALNDAVKALEKKPADKVDKTALNEAIAKAEAIDRDQYTDETLRALDIALEAAKRLAESDSILVTQRTVDLAASALNTAIDNLAKKDDTPVDPGAADKTALNQAIRDAGAVQRDRYSAASLAVMDEKLEAAKAVRDNADATQAEVDAAAEALTAAIAALETKPAGTDMTGLQAAIAAAQSVDRSKYTDASLKEMDNALASAQIILNLSGVSQAQVDAAAKRLNDAVKALEEKGDSDKCDGGASCPSRKFIDVDQREWYHEYVDYAITHGLFAGTSDVTFEPNTAMTRGMLVMVLYRMDGSPAVTGSTTFVDVEQGSWYNNAVVWAAKNRIVNGIDSSHFAPEANLNREQAMTMLMRYADYKGYDTSTRADLSSFPDSASVSLWAMDAMRWGVGTGLIQGTGMGMLSPQLECSRAQVAAILMRFQENLAK